MNRFKNPQLDHTQTEQSRLIAKLMTGLAIIAYGVLILLKQLGFPIPPYAYSWEMGMIVLGLIITVKHRFRSWSGYLLILIGKLYLFSKWYPETFDIRMILPILLIVFGVIVVFKAALRRKKDPNISIFTDNSETEVHEDGDTIDSIAFFAGVTKKIISKNFKGGKVKTVFGGTEINLSQADIQEKIVLEITNSFGGVNIIVPPDWVVHSQINSIFGGIDDKRNLENQKDDVNKTLILKGNCFFGGIEIESLEA